MWPARKSCYSNYGRKWWMTLKCTKNLILGARQRAIWHSRTIIARSARSVSGATQIDSLKVMCSTRESWTTRGQWTSKTRWSSLQRGAQRRGQCSKISILEGRARTGAIQCIQELLNLPSRPCSSLRTQITAETSAFYQIRPKFLTKGPLSMTFTPRATVRYTTTTLRKAAIIALRLKTCCSREMATSCTARPSSSKTTSVVASCHKTGQTNRGKRVLRPEFN